MTQKNSKCVMDDMTTYNDMSYNTKQRGGKVPKPVGVGTTQEGPTVGSQGRPLIGQTEPEVPPSMVKNPTNQKEEKPQKKLNRQRHRKSLFTRFLATGRGGGEGVPDFKMCQKIVILRRNGKNQGGA